MTTTVDVTESALYRNGFPHEFFADLRARGPVHRNRRVTLQNNAVAGPVEFWSLVGHAAIERANRDWGTFTAFDGPGMHATPPERRGKSIVSMDPPDHSRLRRVISAAFTPRMIAELEGHIERRTAKILDEVGRRGECDFVDDVAYQLPMHVIADIMGIPESDRPWVFERTEVMLKALDPSLELGEPVRKAAESDLYSYAQSLSASKRNSPDDDIWTTLATAELKSDDGESISLSQFELDLFFVVLSIAGSETTRNALSQGLIALLENPDQLAALRADPGLVSTATDEIIRWASPVTFFGRTVTKDVEFFGADLKEGDRVIMWYPAGNRDDTVFDEPGKFDIRRSPNPHVSFGGGGPHYCLGASLAKKEVAVMTRALATRFDVEITGEPRWCGAGVTSNVGVSIDALPVRIAGRAR